MKLRLILPLVAALVTVAPVAQAAVIGTYSNIYGIGQTEPAGHTVTANGVVVSESDPTPFRDRFDFSDLAGSTIDSLSLSITFSGAGPNFAPRTFTIFGQPFTINLPTEIWLLDVAPDSSSTFGQIAGLMDDSDSPLTRTIDASTDAALQETAFADAVNSLSLDFGFRELLGQNNAFVLQSATLTVEGSLSVVPLPAPFWMLLSAVGALALRSRYQTKRFQTASSLS
ncbi:MAG: hypothetical protein AAGF30_11405 [Pseudomonadota bacterium]